MQHADTGGESDFAHKPVLENCAFFTLGPVSIIAGYLIVGGSAWELLGEEEQHAIECNATRGLIGAGNPRSPRTEASGSPRDSRSEVD